MTTTHENKTYSSEICKEIKMKDGTVIPSGSRVELHWEGIKPHFNFPDLNLKGKTSNKTVASMLGLNVPDIEEIGEGIWADGDCESVLGEYVDPDGYDEYGSPSWLLVFGLI